MSDKVVQTRDQLAATYLQQLQTLAFEIATAMEAIAANAIIRLHESVARQEMLCAVLANLASTFTTLPGPVGPLTLASDTPVERKILATSIAIHELNLRYAALLKHSGRSIALLLSLCRTHTGQIQQALEPRPKRQTWSCEM